MNPYYSIAELANILEDNNCARVADALVACGVTLIYEGKPADLSGWKRIQPLRRNSDGAIEIFVMRGGLDHPLPSPEAVVVSAETLPASWKDLIAEKESTTNVNEVAQISPHRWPWGDYETDLLRKLAAVADRLWKRYDPTDNTTAPTNQQVIDWLKDQGVAERTAEIMATILRADGLPTGPRK